jgi:hypothetical protein
MNMEDAPILIDYDIDGFAERDGQNALGYCRRSRLSL